MSRTWDGRGMWIAAFVLAAWGAWSGSAPAARAATWEPAPWIASAAGVDVAAAAAEGAAGAGATGETYLRLASSDAGGRDLGFASSRRQPVPVPTPRGPLLRRLRANTISLGLQGQYGGVRGSSRLADGFDHGPGYAFRFRYMLSRSSALGFSFEHQRYGSVQPPLNVPGDFADSHVVLTTISVEGVFYKGREREVHPYFVLGAGYASPDIVYSDDIASRVNEGAFLVGGLGFERFIRQRFSIDGSLRVIGQIANSEFSSIGQVSLGIHLYPGD
ncbi:MAG TPA: hypothetical protein VLT84_13675 [Acidobacteriota bacterium]|nr:hypothetical protein [Acidobacteriota bacterium]